MMLEEALWQDPARMGGTVCFRDSRVPVRILFEHLALDKLDEFYDGFEIPREQVEAVLQAASQLVQREMARAD